MMDSTGQIRDWNIYRRQLYYVQNNAAIWQVHDVTPTTENQSTVALHHPSTVEYQTRLSICTLGSVLWSYFARETIFAFELVAFHAFVYVSSPGVLHIKSTVIGLYGRLCPVP